MSLAIKAARARQLRRRPMGDPGLFGFINSAAKKLSGLPIIGGVASTVDALIPDKTSLTPGGFISGMPPVGPGMPPMPPQGQIRIGPVTVDPLGSGAPGMGVTFGPQAPMATTQNGQGVAVPPSGFHLNKTGYFLKDGTYVPPRSRYVKNRRRNPLNPRALSRALSRLDSAKKAATVMQRFSIRKPKRC